LVHAPNYIGKQDKFSLYAYGHQIFDQEIVSKGFYVKICSGASNEEAINIIDNDKLQPT